MLDQEDSSSKTDETTCGLISIGRIIAPLGESMEQEEQMKLEGIQDALE